jgi:hypothetical protein
MSLKMKLKRKHVTLVDESNLTFKCDKCGAVWSPNLREDGKLPRGYWRCPNGCNWRATSRKKEGFTVN